MFCSDGTKTRPPSQRQEKPLPSKAFFLSDLWARRAGYCGRYTRRILVQQIKMTSSSLQITVTNNVDTFVWSNGFQWIYHFVASVYYIFPNEPHLVLKFYSDYMEVQNGDLAMLIEKLSYNGAGTVNLPEENPEPIVLWFMDKPLLFPEDY